VKPEGDVPAAKVSVWHPDLAEFSRSFAINFVGMWLLPCAHHAVLCEVLQGCRLPALPAVVTLSLPRPLAVAAARDTGTGCWQGLTVSKNSLFAFFFQYFTVQGGNRTHCQRDITVCLAPFQ